MKQIPQDINAEKALLGAMILSKDVIDESNIHEDYFYTETNRTIYKIINKLYTENVPIDPNTIIAENSIIDTVYLQDCVDRGIITNNAKHYETIIAEKAKLRNYIEVMQNALEMAFEGESPESELMLLENIELNSEDELLPISVMLNDAVEHIDYLQTKKGYEGIETKINMYDYMMDGLRKQTFNVIAARPAMGKTALALQISNRVTEQSLKVGFFSLEMGRNELARRLIINESQVHGKLIKDKKLDTKEWSMINKAAAKLHRQNLYISDRFDQTVTSIYKQCKKLKKKHGLDLVIIDYLQLLKPDGKFNNKNDEVGHNSRILKKIAKDLDVPVICLSQLSRTCESRPNPHKRPVMSDLRDSGSIEQDADTITMIYRDDVYKDKDAQPDREVELIIRKNRAGETGTVTLEFDGGRQSFKNL